MFITTQPPVAQQVEFIQSLPSLEGCPPSVNLPLSEDSRTWPRSFEYISDIALKQHVLRYCPGGVGVLIDGKVYRDDRIFWLEGLLETARQYEVVYRKPDVDDLHQRAQDHFWGVLHAEDFPSAEAVEAETRIVYVNQQHWAAQRLEEQQKAEELSLPSYEDSLSSLAYGRKVGCARMRRCLKSLAPLHLVFLRKMKRSWRHDPVECRRNPIYKKLRAPMRPEADDWYIQWSSDECLTSDSDVSDSEESEAEPNV